MINAKGTEYVFETAKMWGSKVIFASTSDVYGMSSDLPLREDGDLLLGPSMIKRWSYAVSKLYGEQLAFSYYKDCQVPTVILRYFVRSAPVRVLPGAAGIFPFSFMPFLIIKKLLSMATGRRPVQWLM